MPLASSCTLISCRRATDTPCSASCPMRCIWTSFIATSPHVTVHASFGYAGGSSTSSARILAWQWSAGPHQHPSVLPRSLSSSAWKAGPTMSRRRCATDLPSSSCTMPPSWRFCASFCVAGGSSLTTSAVVALGDARDCVYARNRRMLLSSVYLPSPSPTGKGLANIEPALTVGELNQPPSHLGRAT